MDNTIEILKFSAPWCGPCAAYLPVIESWWEKQAWKWITLTSIDLEATPEEWSNYRVMTVPTTILLINGVETKRKAWPMTPDELDEFIKI